MRFGKCEFCEKWDFENVNFVKNEISKMWISWKIRFSKCEFREKWGFQNVNFWKNWGFLPQCVNIPSLIEWTENGSRSEYEADNAHDGWENKHLGVKA